jgi:hypothetical protein
MWRGGWTLGRESTCSNVFDSEKRSDGVSFGPTDVECAWEEASELGMRVWFCEQYKEKNTSKVSLCDM